MTRNLCLLLAICLLVDFGWPARLLQGMPVQVKSYFAGQYQSPVLRLELGENYETARADKKYVIDDKDKVKVEPVKVHQVFDIQTPSVKIRGKARGKGPA